MACQGYSRRGQRDYLKKFLLPLTVIFILSFGFVLFINLIPDGGLWRKVFLWVSIVISSLLGLVLAYFLIWEGITYKAYKQGWNKQAQNAWYRLDIDTDGILFNSATQSPKAKWDRLNRYFETENLIILCEDRKFLAIPKRILDGKEQQRQFLEVVDCLVDANQDSKS